MKIIKIAEGAFFVPPYYSPMIHSSIPGVINQSVQSAELEKDIANGDSFIQEDAEDFLKKVPAPLRRLIAKQ